MPSRTHPRDILVIRHVDNVPIGSLGNILHKAGIGWRYVDLHVEVPSCLPLESAAGLVILGGPMSVNDTADHPFLTAEPPWIREAIERELPTLGICLGAQLMAKALGKPVYANKQKEIGFFDVALAPAAAADPLFGGSRPIETVFQWHRDTFDLPDEAVRLASSPLCLNQAYRVGRRAWGVQFHAEMTAPLAREWLDTKLLTHNDVDPAPIAKDLDVRMPAMEAFCHRLLNRFAAFCR